MVQISEIASRILVFADIKKSIYPPIIISTNCSIFLYFYHTTPLTTNTCSTNSNFFAYIVVYRVFNACNILAALSVPGVFVTFVAPGALVAFDISDLSFFVAFVAFVALGAFVVFVVFVPSPGALVAFVSLSLAGALLSLLSSPAPSILTTIQAVKKSHF